MVGLSNIVLDVCEWLFHIFVSCYFTLVFQSFVVLLQICLLVFLAAAVIRLRVKMAYVLPVCVALIGNMIHNIWKACEILRTADILNIGLYHVSRAAHAGYLLFYLMMFVFVDMLLMQSVRLHRYIRTVVVVSGLFLSIFFSITAFFETFVIQDWMVKLVDIYVFMIMSFLLYQFVYVCTRMDIARVLKKQYTLFFGLLLTHYLLSDFFRDFCFVFFDSWNFGELLGVNQSLWVNTAEIVSISIIYFGLRRLTRIRFLNLKKEVDTGTFIKIEEIEQTNSLLQAASSVGESYKVVQAFFKNAFKLPSDMIRMNMLAGPQEMEEIFDRSKVLEIYNDYELKRYLLEHKTLIRDEIEFSLLYEDRAVYHKALELLNIMNAAVFIPIYSKSILIAYITVDKGARSSRRLFSKSEREEMVVFAAYLSSVISYLQCRNAQQILRQVVSEKKKLEEQVYYNHQKIRYYEESIAAFLQGAEDRKIGIVEYKSRKFVCSNQEAEMLLDCDLNKQKGHPITRSLKRMVEKVQSYRTSQTEMITVTDNQRLTATAIPVLGKQSVIIVIYRPDVADMVKSHLNLINDPSDWDYVLYLETTAVGRSINRLIPGSGAVLSSMKIDLVKSSLSRKATLFVGPKKDRKAAIDLLYSVSLRDQLETVSLEGPEVAHEYAIKIFGIDLLLNNKADQNKKCKSLLKQLDLTGTLYIENIHYLSLETQEYLAEFLETGSFRTFRGTRTVRSNVRVICSSEVDCKRLVQEGKFLKKLWVNLETFRLPDMELLEDEEFAMLVEGIAHQICSDRAFDKSFLLSDKEKQKIKKEYPKSVQELRRLVYEMLEKKAKNNLLSISIKMPSDMISAPELNLGYIATLGKNALKDKACMVYLWKEFGGSQTKIANLLGVNRSSVSRRCRFYDLQ